MILEKWSEIEEEFTWRLDELRFLKNQIELLNKEESRKILRRSTILMMYAHFEGFFKFSFQLYIKCINERNLLCSQINTPLLVSAFDDIFRALRNPSSKSKIFAKSLPEDTKLHSLSRSVDFLDELQDHMNGKVSISENIANTESNLKPVVLKKILFMLGLDYELFQTEQGEINQLLGLRNKIAHGETRAGIEEADFRRLYGVTSSLLRTIKSKIMTAITNEEFLKTS